MPSNFDGFSDETCRKYNGMDEEERADI